MTDLVIGHQDSTLVALPASSPVSIPTLSLCLGTGRYRAFMVSFGRQYGGGMVKPVVSRHGSPTAPAKGLRCECRDGDALESKLVPLVGFSVLDGFPKVEMPPQDHSEWMIGPGLPIRIVQESVSVRDRLLKGDRGNRARERLSAKWPHTWLT